MNRIYVLFFLCFVLSASAQQKIDYGNNPAAGKYYNIRGIKIYCEIYGEGKPLLMIHGNGGSIKSFEHNISFFSKKYKVIVMDSRAQGKSVDTKDSLTFEMMADDEAALLDQLHVDSAYVLGWSDGGINALLLAIRHPEKVIRLAATGANLWPDSTAFFPESWKNDHTRHDTTHTEHFNAREKYEWKLFELDYLEPHISLEQLHMIKCPALIIAGDHDVIRPEHTLLIYQNIRGAYLWILPNSSHSTLIDHRDEFNRKVDDFFSRKL